MPKLLWTFAIAVVVVCSAACRASANETQQRLTPDEIAKLPTLGAGTGTSGVAGIRTTVLSGDPNKAGLYTIWLVIPPQTLIKPHHHRDDRVATVVFGLWYIGYGAQRDAAALKALPPGSFYTEPAGAPHFAGTQDQPAVVDITGIGPSDTIYVDASDDRSGAALDSAVQPFPAGFQVKDFATDGATIHVRVGGAGSAVVMLHGFGDTGDMWAPVAAALMRDHTVIVPDLRGMGLSSHPEDGYDKKTQAHDIAQVMNALNIDKAAFVTHDIGNMVGYAFAAQFPARVTRWVAIDAPLPGIGPWDEILRNPLLWHFNFRGPDAERLVAGRERIYLDRFWDELSFHPEAIGEATRRHYAELYSRPGAMHSAFNQFAAFGQDAIDNKALAAKGKLTMPILALGADHSFGTQMADVMRFVATDITGGVIADSGHWVMEEQPKQTTAAIVNFLDKN